MSKIDEVLKFWDDSKNQTVFSQDKEDFQRSKNFASGNGFYAIDTKVWAKNRAKVFADFISSEVEGIVALLELAPPEITNFEFDRKMLQDVLREMLQDGKSYILAYNKGSQLKIKTLSNLQTYINEDFTKAVHVSRITKEAAEEKGVSFRETDKTLIDSFSSTLDISKDETYLLTYYEKTKDGVEISEFIGKEQAGKTVKLNLRYLPIIAFLGKRQQVNNRPNYRGIYYKAKDILITIAFLLSYLQEKIASAPNVKFLVPEEALGDNTKQWEEINGEPKAFLTYKARDPLDLGGTNLPPPIPQEGIPISEIIQLLNICFEILRNIMGSDVAGVGKSHETAESVLLRREKKDASGNAYIRSLLSGMEVLAKVLTDYYALLGTPAECEVVDRYFVKMKQNRERETIMSLMQIAEKSPAFAAILAEKTDLDETTQQQVIAATNVQNLLTQAQTWQQQLQQNAQVIQTLQQQVDALSKQNTELENSKIQEVQSAQIRAEVELQKTLIQNETEILKLEFEKEKSDVDFKLRFEEMSRRALETLKKITGQ